MRFAYIDSQGKEVGIPTEDALRLRIALKAIVDDTRFFDAETEVWAPAREHEVFQRLSKELAEEDGEGFVAPPPPVMGERDELEVEPLPEGVDRSGGEPDDEWHFSITNTPSDPEQAAAPATPVEVDAAEPTAPAAGGDASAGPPPEPDEVEAQEPGPVAGAGADWVEPGDHEGDPVFDLGAADLVEERDPGPGLEALELDAVDTPVAETPFRGGGAPIEDADELAPAAEAPDAPPPEAETPPGFTPTTLEFEQDPSAAAWGDEPPPPPPAKVQPPRRSSGPPASEPGLPSRDEVARRPQAPRPQPVSATPPSRPQAIRRSKSRGGGALVGAVVALAVVGGGAWWFLTGESPGGAETAEPPEPEVVIPDLPPALEPTMRSVAERARGASIEGLRSLPAQAGVPVEPPGDWLAGVYMANASRYPGVPEYWEALNAFLRRMQAVEDSLFHARLDAELEGLAPDERDPIAERVRAGYRATQRERAQLFTQAREVGDAAQRLHVFLLDNEPGIAYDPAAGGISRDPVLEAVPDDPAVGEEMWDRVGEITDAMDGLGFLDRVTTERLVGAVLTRLSDIGVR